MKFLNRLFAKVVMPSLLCTMILPVSLCKGGILAEESFQFSAAVGEIAGKGSGSGWTGGWQIGQGGNDMYTVQGLMQADGGLLAVSGNALADGAAGASTVYRELAAPLAEEVLYLSFLIRFPNRFMGFVGLGTESHDNVHATAAFRVGRVGEGEDERDLAYWDPVAASWVLTGTKLEDNRSYWIVLKAEKVGLGWGGGDDALSIWVNPMAGSSEPAPDWKAEGANFGNLDGTRVLLGNNWNGPIYDEVRIGTDWESVTPEALELPSIEVTGAHGTVTLEPDKASYDFGEEVTLTVVPDDGFLFSGWAGDVSGFDNPLTIPVTGKLEVTASFVDASEGYSLSIEALNGSVMVNPAKEAYVYGERIMLEAVPDEGYRFTGWNEEVLDYRKRAEVEIRGDLDVRPIFVKSPMGHGGTGATVRESFVEEVLHVNPQVGIDTQPGTPEEPLRTIKRAFARAEQLISQGKGVKILLQAGIYREEVVAPAARFTAPLVIEGEGWQPGINTGDVILTTATQLEAGTLNADGVYELPWEHNWGFQDDPFGSDPVPTNPRLLRFEWIFHDDAPFLHELSYEDLINAEGYRVYVDEESDTLYLKAPAGVDLASGKLEICMYPSGSPNGANFLLWIKGTQENPRSHIVVRNLVFEKASPGFQRGGLHIHNADNILVEDVVANYIHSTGIVANDADYSTFRNVVTHHNTNQGMVIGSLQESRVEGAHIKGNNFVGFTQGYVSWTPAGLKSGAVRRTSYLDILLEENYCHGLWLDTAMEDILVERLRILNNARYGLYYENNNRNNISGLGDRTSAIVRNTVFAGNGERSSIYQAGGLLATGSGIFLVESENLWVEHSVFYRHDEHIGIGYNNRGPLGNFVLRNSVLGEPTGDNGVPFRQAGNLIAWRQFYDTISNDYNGNMYFDKDDTPFFGRDLSRLTFSGWKDALSSNPFNPDSPVSPDSNSVFIQEYDQTTWQLLHLEALRDAVSEGDAATAVFRVTRVEADLSAPLTLSLEVESLPGRSTAEDFSGGIPPEVTIPAGEMYTDIELTPAEDGLPEGPELLTLSLSVPEPYLSFSSAATLEVQDLEVQDLPRVNVSAVASHVTEGSDSVVQFLVERDGDTSSSLEVQFELNGTGVEGEDYRFSETVLQVPAGASFVMIEVDLLDDSLAEYPDTLVFQVLRSNALAYAPGSSPLATVTIADNDLLVSSETVHVSGPLGSVHPFDLEFANPGDGNINFAAAGLANAWDLQVSERLDWSDSTNGDPVSFTYSNPNDDGYSAAIPIGFSFPYFGQVFDRLYIQSNGLVLFNDPAGSSSDFRVPVELPAEGDGVLPYLIASYWRNWGLDGSSRVRTHTDVNGQFVVTFEDVIQLPAFPTKRRATWQVALRQSGQIEIRFLEDATRGDSLIGLNGGNLLEGFTLDETVSATPGSRLLFTPLVPLLDGLPSSVELEGGATKSLSASLDSEALAAGVYSFSLDYRSSSPSIPLVSLPLEVRVGVGLSSMYWPESIGHDNFFTEVMDFGWVFDYYTPFVHHVQHGWLGLVSAFDGGLLYYDYGMEAYGFTALGGVGLYPWVAFFKDGTWEWYYYLLETTNPRWFWTADGYLTLP